MKGLLKFIGVMSAIILFVVGIYVGNEMGMFDFEFLPAFIIWMVGFFILISCYYLAKILENQEDIRDLLSYIALNTNGEDKVNSVKFNDINNANLKERMHNIVSKMQCNVSQSNQNESNQNEQ